MAKLLPEISPELEVFIDRQKIFFVGTAMAEGRINVSPKGMDTLKVMDANKIVWLNLTGSGNETATHVLNSNRMTIMFCSFEGKPLILRLYGKAKIYHEGDKKYEGHIGLFPENMGSRQIIEMEIELVQTSCGFAVPFMNFEEERTQLEAWANNRGKDRIKEYWEENNTRSLDGHDTGMHKVLEDQ